MKSDTSRGFALTSVQAQYVVERLNTVFGFDGWRFSGDFEAATGGVLYFGTLSVRTGTETVVYTAEDGTKAEAMEDQWHEVEGVGYAATKKNLGDTYKSARTDCLGKAASLLGVANDVFKGNVPPPSSGSSGGSKSVASPRNSTTSSEVGKTYSRFPKK